MRKQKLQPAKSPLQIIQGPQFMVCHHEGKGAFALQSHFHDHFPISLIMVDRGENIMVASKNISPRAIPANRLQLIFDPKKSLHFSYMGSKKWAFFEVQLSPAIFRELPNIDSGLWQSFITKIKQGKPAVLSELTLAYKTSLQEAVHLLFFKQFADQKLQLKYQDLKLKEILLHLFYECQQPVTENDATTLKERNLASNTLKVLEKCIVGNEFTIISLAEDFGTNETTLKQAFKKVTGTTIYQHFLQKRMNRAKALLQDGTPVSKVSASIGYSNVSHFSFQFKKTFGITPEQIKARL